MCLYDSVIGQPLSPPPTRSEVQDEQAVFRASRMVRADAVRPDNGLRFDGVARYLQDAGQDHLTETGFDEIHSSWPLAVK